ncbi:hypothetical protein [uncultured Desulfobacter sp.]|uniref:hypothetical protein n=1 Tax=uncultured Desulfobacter sp. TaxID=240139 RepID=UPI0029C61E05|nr:hypothetical protein [uncultured Desulfobacter sp.]
MPVHERIFSPLVFLIVFFIIPNMLSVRLKNLTGMWFQGIRSWILIATVMLLSSTQDIHPGDIVN